MSQENPNQRQAATPSWVDDIKTVIILILSTGAWIGGLYKAFIGTPPPNDAGQPEALTFVARIVIASFFVLWGSLAFQLARADHVRFWRNLLLLSLVLTL